MTLLNMDPPKHNRYRRLVSAGFTPRMITELQRRRSASGPGASSTTIAERGECEFVEDVAAELPLQVICEMIGVPEEDRHLVFDWSNRLVGFQDPDFRTTPEDGEMAAAEIYAYCDAIAADRRANPRDDIMSTLVHAEVDGDRLTDMELNMFFVLLVVAGNETTRNLIAHAMLAVIEHPDARAELLAGIDDDALWATATEEFLRWGSSIHNFRRTATQRHRDPRRAHRRGRQGRHLLHVRQPRRGRLRRPDRFDVRRTPNDHVTFGGGGVHFCLGANLARARDQRPCRARCCAGCPTSSSPAPSPRMRSDFINGIKSMPVQFTGSPLARRRSHADRAGPAPRHRVPDLRLHPLPRRRRRRVATPAASASSAPSASPPSSSRSSWRWIDEHVGDRPYGVDIVIPGKYEGMGEIDAAKLEADLRGDDPPGAPRLRRRDPDRARRARAARRASRRRSCSGGRRPPPSLRSTSPCRTPRSSCSPTPSARRPPTSSRRSTTPGGSSPRCAARPSRPAATRRRASTS